MIGLHAKRYEWEHDEDELLDNFVNFTKADTYPDPVCLLGKDWQVIQFDLIKRQKDKTGPMSGYYAAAAQCTRCIEEVGCTAKKKRGL